MVYNVLKSAATEAQATTDGANSSIFLGNSAILRKNIDKDMIKKDLRLQTGLSTSTMSKLSKDENVSMDIIEKICTVLNCDVGDIMEFVPDKKEEQ